MVDKKHKLQLLKDILLTDDRKSTNNLSKRVQEIEALLETKETVSHGVNPVINDKLEEFSNSFPEKLGPTITKTLEQQIANSKNKVVEALYPILRKMVKRFIQNEFQKLSEKITEQTNKALSFDYLKKKLRAFFTGVKEEDIILNELANPIVEQLFLIEKDSGILLGNYSVKKTIDQDLISGMITAIKSFVEDAFEGSNQNLKQIEYELYHIHIQTFHMYYIAAVISGPFTEHFKDQITDKILFTANEINKLSSLKDQELINALLSQNFNHEHL